MDKNEFLKLPYPFLYRHYWFFRHIFKAPSWQRYFMTALVISILFSSWYLYWYIPTTEQKLKYKQQLEANDQQQQLHKHLQKKLQEQKLFEQELPSLSVSTCIVALITQAEQQKIGIANCTPLRDSIHKKNISSNIHVSSIALVLYSNDYESMMHFINAVITKYPMIQILDMLVRKSDQTLMLNIQLQVLTSTHETPSHTALASGTSHTFS